jgi:nucleoside-diphosphate-sugar epimerase
MAEVRPDVVYHLAGLVHTRREMGCVLEQVRHNFVGSLQVLIAAASFGCKRIVLAGSAETGPAERVNGVPNSPYAASKQAACDFARMFHLLYGSPIVIARLFANFGPRQSTDKLIPYIISQYLNGQVPEIHSAERLCDFVFVKDVVEGFLRLGLQPGIEGETIDLGSGRSIKIKELVCFIQKMIPGARPPIFSAPAPSTVRVPENALVADAKRTHDALGWSPRWSLEESLAETVAWYRNASLKAKEEKQ